MGLFYRLGDARKGIGGKDLVVVIIDKLVVSESETGQTRRARQFRCIRP
jgi:hypothetical protein